MITFCVLTLVADKNAEVTLSASPDQINFPETCR